MASKERIKERFNEQRLIMSAILLMCISGTIIMFSCNKKPDYYTASDFVKVPKTDVHLHINSLA